MEREKMMVNRSERSELAIDSLSEGVNLWF